MEKRQEETDQIIKEMKETEAKLKKQGVEWVMKKEGLKEQT